MPEHRPDTDPTDAPGRGRPRVVALLPMRHTSHRVPGKNYRQFAGRPLYHHVLHTLLSVPEIDEVVVDTDSPLMSSQIPDTFPERVRVVLRPEHLRADDIPMNDVLLNTVSQVPADLYVQTHSTNPLLRPATITRALAAFLASPDHDSLFSVTRIQTRLWWGPGKPINHDPAILLRTQDLPPVYEENSNLFVFSEEVLRTHRNRIGVNPLLFEIDAAEAWDIDEELDFTVAEFLYRQQDAEVTAIPEAQRDAVVSA
jgi:CMP-N-acetylneuraminic acid synthetase